MLPGGSERGGDQPLPPQSAPEFVAALEDVSRGIGDPVAKLRFLRGSLAEYGAAGVTLGNVPSPARRLLYRWLSLRSLARVLTGSWRSARLSRRTRFALLASRAVTLAALLGLGAALTAAAYRMPRRGAVMPVIVRPVVAAAAARLQPVAEDLPPLPPGLSPASIWLVESGPGFEQYSNGLRIDTTFAVRDEPRRYKLFSMDVGLQKEVHDRPAGILFHTSESDVWPLEAEFNEVLRDSSQKLVRYLARYRLYHYVIDRFGRVFRLVEEDSRASHAGKSIWARRGDVYLNLNHAFLGLCFETRWEGGRALPITSAQLAAGRSLTDYLRQRWDIPADMCVAHGLTSVNAKQHLIGHHLDWARGFPFEAFGLPDQYLRPTPSVEVFGFGYDEHFLGVLGEPWAGVRAAERALDAEAARQGRSVDEIRRERRGLYDRWIAEQARDEEAVASTRADRAPGRGAPGG